MGQEKSLPSRCNSAHDYHSSATSTTSIKSSAPSQRSSASKQSSKSTSSSKSTKSSSSSSTSSSTSSSSSTLTTASTASSYKSIDRQTKYLNEHLYIKSYLDIEEEDRNAKVQFQKIRPGIRNYTPKILSLEKNKTKQEVDVWI